MPRPLHQYEQERIFRAARRAHGVCYECERPALDGRARCQEHQLLNRLRGLKHRGMPQQEIEKAVIAIAKFSGVCDACYGTDCGEWCVDHDHKTKKFRGIIGSRCNRALGMVKDNMQVLHRLSRYIERNQ